MNASGCKITKQHLGTRPSFFITLDVGQVDCRLLQVRPAWSWRTASVGDLVAAWSGETRSKA